MTTSIWSKIETELAKIFNVSVEVAEVAQPVVDLTAPGISGLYNLAVSAAQQADTDAHAAAATAATTAQKTAAVAAAVAPVLATATAAAGVGAHTQTQINTYASTVVAGLEALAPTPAS